MTPVATITLRQVTKRFGAGAPVVDGVSLEIADGELVILVGPSGCGKSTLLRLIAGLEDVTSGDILVGGRRVTDTPPRDRNLAMVFQSYALYPHLSVFENIAFPLRVRQVPAAEVRERVGEAARMLELTDQLSRRPGQLSGGQRQRVAMGRAIVRHAAAFLFDEPLSNLDAALRGQMRLELLQLQRRLGTTTLYVTHDQTEAMTLGDRVAVLHRGALQQVATPRQLYDEPANLFVAGFIGSPHMNVLPAVVEDGRLRLPFVSLELPADRRGAVGSRRDMVVGVRPEGFGDGEAPDPGAVFTARVEVTEWLGNQHYAHCAAEGIDGARLVVALDPARRIARGDRLALRLDPARLHLFDPDSGQRLG